MNKRVINNLESSESIVNLITDSSKSLYIITLSYHLLVLCSFYWYVFNVCFSCRFVHLCLLFLLPKIVIFV